MFWKIIEMSISQKTCNEAMSYVRMNLTHSSINRKVSFLIQYWKIQSCIWRDQRIKALYKKTYTRKQLQAK
jgi:hypothetical protein